MLNITQTLTGDEKENHGSMTISTFWCYFLYKLRLLRQTKVFTRWKFEYGKSKGVEFMSKNIDKNVCYEYMNIMLAFSTPQAY